MVMMYSQALGPNISRNRDKNAFSLNKKVSKQVLNNILHLLGTSFFFMGAACCWPFFSSLLRPTVKKRISTSVFLYCCVIHIASLNFLFVHLPFFSDLTAQSYLLIHDTHTLHHINDAEVNRYLLYGRCVTFCPCSPLFCSLPLSSCSPQPCCRGLGLINVVVLFQACDGPR